MTVDEYIKKIAAEIQGAGSANDAVRIVEKAGRVLDSSSISDRSKDKFWAGLYNEFGAELSATCESQSAAALAAIVAAAKMAIAQNLRG